jgi:nucleotide-binding universal stress UspA family protein
MTRSVLVGYDPREADHAPVDFGIAMARASGAPLVVAAVEHGVGALVGQTDEDLLDDASEPVDLLERKLRSSGVPFEARRLQSTSAARALQGAAEEANAGLLVVGSSRASNPGRILAGATALRLLHGAPCPVAVAPRGWSEADGIEAVGAAYVDTPEGRAALDAAHALARRIGARLKVFTVVKITPSMHLETEARRAGTLGQKEMVQVEGEHRVAAEEHLREVVAGLEGGVPVEAEAFVGDPADEIVHQSTLLDLLVCGSRGYGPARAVLLGSVSRKVMAEAGCPAIVLARGVDRALEELLAEQSGAAAAA